MKRLILIIASLLLGGIAFAQTDELKGFQWGVSYGQELYIGAVEHWANATFGYRFNKGNYLGAKTGYIFGRPVDAKYNGIPLMLDYIHYFPLGKAQRHSVFAGVEIGNHFLKSNRGRGYVDDSGSLVVENRPVLTSEFRAYAKAGLDFNIADVTHLQLGFNIGYVFAGASVGFTF